jgi:hypothetical protein
MNKNTSFVSKPLSTVGNAHQKPSSLSTGATRPSMTWECPPWKIVVGSVSCDLRTHWSKGLTQKYLLKVKQKLFDCITMLGF